MHVEPCDDGSLNSSQGLCLVACRRLLAGEWGAPVRPTRPYPGSGAVSRALKALRAWPLDTRRRPSRAARAQTELSGLKTHACANMQGDAWTAQTSDY